MISMNNNSGSSFKTMSFWALMFSVCFICMTYVTENTFTGIGVEAAGIPLKYPTHILKKHLEKTKSDQWNKDTATEKNINKKDIHDEFVDFEEEENHERGGGEEETVYANGDFDINLPSLSYNNSNSALSENNNNNSNVLDNRININITVPTQKYDSQLEDKQNLEIPQILQLLNEIRSALNALVPNTTSI